MVNTVQFTSSENQKPQGFSLICVQVQIHKIIPFLPYNKCPRFDNM